jgi:serine/threonine-protein kinase
MERGPSYVAHWGNNRVVKLGPGATTQTELPFGGLHSPSGLTVDSAGAVYVADKFNNRVLQLAAGTSTQNQTAGH